MNVLERLIPEAEREFVLGDLDEIYGQRRSLRRNFAVIRIGMALRLGHASDLPACRPADLPTTRHSIPTLMTDLRYAVRQLARSPGFTLLAVLTLALGIGATTAIFSVVNPILFTPLPYPAGDRIVALFERDADGSESLTGYESFLDVQKQSTAFEGVAVASQWQPTLQDRGDSERLNGQRVTRAFFGILGVRPELGRDFTDEENVRGKHRVTILSNGLWQRRFGSDPHIVGRQVTFDGIQYIVVGVMPRKFESLFSPQAELWAPLGYETTLPWACRDCRHLREIGRLKPGISPERARTELDVISTRLAAQYPDKYPATGMFVVPLQTLITRNVRPALLAVLGAVALVLLIACANVAALLLGRAVQREAEFAIRGALGAGRSRVARQLLTESVLLALLGGGVGTALAWLGVKGLVALGPGTLPRLSAIGLDARVLGFTAVVALASGLLFGMVPAVAAAKPDLFSALRPGGRHTGQRSRRLARGALVITEVALALMLLAGAGLLLRSLGKLLGVDPGFEARGLLTMEVQTTGARYADNAPTWAYFDQALAAAKQVPGVESAAWVSMLPLGGDFNTYGIQVEGHLLANPEQAPSADRFAVSPEYLATMKIPLKRGRFIGPDDLAKAPPVVVVNEALAKAGWQGADAMGGRIQMGGSDQPWRTVVGIVGDVHHTGLDRAPAPQIYLPEAQAPGADGAMVLVARTRNNPAALLAPVRAAIRAIDPSLPILNVATMEEVLSVTTQQRRFAFLLFQIFAAVALVLAAAGIYGVLAAGVSERTREIGIRAALGASRQGVLALVVREGVGLTLAGLALGTIGALALSRFLAKLLYGVGARDPVTLVAVMGVLLLVAVVASWAPAWRATRVSPLEALRGE